MYYILYNVNGQYEEKQKKIKYDNIVYSSSSHNKGI